MNRTKFWDSNKLHKALYNLQPPLLGPSHNVRLIHKEPLPPPCVPHRLDVIFGGYTLVQVQLVALLQALHELYLEDGERAVKRKRGSPVFFRVRNK